MQISYGCIIYVTQPLYCLRSFGLPLKQLSCLFFIVFKRGECLQWVRAKSHRRCSGTGTSFIGANLLLQEPRFKRPINISEADTYVRLNWRFIMPPILADFFDDGIQTPGKVTVTGARASSIRRSNRSPTDIKAWLAGNAPRNLEELKTLRYCLYHRCSRGDFKVKKKFDKDYFSLVGRAGSLLIVSNKARRYLLWQLRQLRKQTPWQFEA